MLTINKQELLYVESGFNKLSYTIYFKWNNLPAFLAPLYLDDDTKVGVIVCDISLTKVIDIEELNFDSFTLCLQEFNIAFHDDPVEWLLDKNLEKALPLTLNYNFPRYLYDSIVTNNLVGEENLVVNSINYYQSPCLQVREYLAYKGNKYLKIEKSTDKVVVNNLEKINYISSSEKNAILNLNSKAKNRMDDICLIMNKYREIFLGIEEN